MHVGRYLTRDRTDLDPTRDALPKEQRETKTNLYSNRIQRKTGTEGKRDQVERERHHLHNALGVYPAVAGR